MPYSDEDRQFLADHGDPGPDDIDIEREAHNERMRDEPTLSAWERNQ